MKVEQIYSLMNNVTSEVNLLKDYNAKFGTELTVDKALTTPEFIRYASYIIGNNYVKDI